MRPTLRQFVLSLAAASLFSCSGGSGGGDGDVSLDSVAEIEGDARGEDQLELDVRGDVGLGDLGGKDVVEPDIAEDVVLPVETAKVRVILLSPDAPPVDVFFKDLITPASEDLAFGQGTEFTEVAPGTYDLVVTPAGAGVAQAVLNLDGLVLEKGKAFTSVAFGLLDEIQGLFLQDNLSAVAPGMARIRFVHTAEGAGELDILVIPEELPPAALVQGLSFGQAGDHVEVPVGSHKLGVDLDLDGDADVVFLAPELVDGDIANVFVVTLENAEFVLYCQFADGRVESVLAEPDVVPELAELRVLHLDPAAGPVDVYVNKGEQPVIDGLEYMDGTDYVELPEGLYDFDVVPSGGTLDQALLSVQGISLQGLRKYSVAAIGDLGEAQDLNMIALVVQDDFTGVGAGKVRGRVGHAAPLVNTLDVWIAGSDSVFSLLFGDVEFSTMTEYSETIVGAFTLGVDATDDGEPDVLFDVPLLPEGTVANMYVVVDEEGPHLVSQLNDCTVFVVDGVVVEEPLTFAVRTIHLQPAVSSVDIYLNQGPEPAVTGLGYKQVTPYFWLEEGTFDVDVVPAGQELADSILSLVGVAFTGAQSYTAVFFAISSGEFDGFAGLGSSGIVAALVQEDLGTVSEGMIRLTAFHAAAPMGEIDVYQLVEGSPPTLLIENFGLGEGAPAMELPVGEIRLGVDLDNDSEMEQSFLVPAFPAGSVFDLFAVIDDGGAYLLALLYNGATVVITPEV